MFGTFISKRGTPRSHVEGSDWCIITSPPKLGGLAESMDLAIGAYELTRKFPKEELLSFNFIIKARSRFRVPQTSPTGRKLESTTIRDLSVQTHRSFNEIDTQLHWRRI